MLVGTSAYSAWLRRLASTFVPVYDYVLMTEPLTAGQQDAIGWAGREGMSDAGNDWWWAVDNVSITGDLVPTQSELYVDDAAISFDWLTPDSTL